MVYWREWRTRDLSRLTVFVGLAALLTAACSVDDAHAQVARPTIYSGTNIITGIVRTGDGKPVSDAEVVVSSNHATASLKDFGVDCRSCLKTVTREDGAFSMPWPERSNMPQVMSDSPIWFDLVVATDEGFASAWYKDISSATPLVMTLTPWGRIEGTYLIDGKPAAGRNIEIEMRGNIAYLSEDNSRTTDEKGHFVYARVRPGKIRLLERHWLHWCKSMGAGLSNYTISVDLKPGETEKVMLGSGGRPVVAKIVLSPTLEADYGWEKLPAKCGLSLAGSDIPWPEGIEDYRRDSWLRDWVQTDDGEAYREAAERCGTFPLGNEGAVRIPDVPAGKYRLTVTLFERWSDEFCDKISMISYPISPVTIATVVKEFEVPPIPGGRSDEALDLGELVAGQ